jgi:hypothetical protein
MGDGGHGGFLRQVCKSEGIKGAALAQRRRSMVPPSTPFLSAAGTVGGTLFQALCGDG